MSAEKSRRLGRGLDALIPSLANASPASDLQRIPISRIRANPFQPRREFDPAELAELEASLKASGLLQPISVRRRGDAYELIAGERRVRAATKLGWTDISALVRDFDDQTMLVLALVENLQRANLNAIEEARGYRRLIDEFQLTQQHVAEAVGKDRTTVTNMLRMLTLPDAVQALVEQGRLTAGHARALLALQDKAAVVEIANRAADRQLSVRELEQHVRDLGKPEPANPSVDLKQARQTRPDPAARQIEDELRRYLQTDVRMSLTGPDKGKIELLFYSADDLDRLLELILRENRRDF